MTWIRSISGDDSVFYPNISVNRVMEEGEKVRTFVFEVLAF